MEITELPSASQPLKLTNCRYVYYLLCIRWFPFCHTANKRRTRNSRHTVITGNIVRSAKRRYLSYSEADFEIFRPSEATRYTDGGEIYFKFKFQISNFTPTEIFTEI